MSKCTDWHFELHGGERPEWDDWRQADRPGYPDHLCVTLSRFEVEALVKKWLPELLDKTRPADAPWMVCWLGKLEQSKEDD